MSVPRITLDQGHTLPQSVVVPPTPISTPHIFTIHCAPLEPDVTCWFSISLKRTKTVRNKKQQALYLCKKFSDTCIYQTADIA